MFAYISWMILTRYYLVDIYQHLIPLNSLAHHHCEPLNHSGYSSLVMYITHDTIKLQNGSDSSVGRGERERLLFSDRVMVTIGEFYCNDDRCMGVFRANFCREFG